MSAGKWRDPKPPKHPKTKKELVGGFDPASIVRRPFGFRETIDTCEFCVDNCEGCIG
jgi:hypothetical protein